MMNRTASGIRQYKTIYCAALAWPRWMKHIVDLNVMGFCRCSWWWCCRCSCSLLDLPDCWNRQQWRWRWRQRHQHGWLRHEREYSSYKATGNSARVISFKLYLMLSSNKNTLLRRHVQACVLPSAIEWYRVVAEDSLYLCVRVNNFTLIVSALRSIPCPVSIQSTTCRAI